LPGLLERYRDAQAQEAARALARHRAAMIEAFQSLEQSIVAADAANRSAVQTWEAACRDLGHQVVNLNFPILYFGAPLNAETITHWRREVGAALLPVRIPTVAVPSPVPRAVVPMTRVAPKPEASAPKKNCEPIMETPGNGELRVTVMRDGYESPSGKQCAQGDRIAMTPEVARTDVINGAVEYVSGEVAA
jgi:hypothetical protein